MPIRLVQYSYPGEISDETATPNRPDTHVTTPNSRGISSGTSFLDWIAYVTYRGTHQDKPPSTNVAKVNPSVTQMKVRLNKSNDKIVSSPKNEF